MAKLLFSGTHGSNDPTRAALPLLGAIGGVDAGHDVEVFLLGEAAYLMKDEIANAVNPVAFPNVGQMLRDLIGRGVRFYIWGGCADARAVSQTDLRGKNASFTDPVEWANHLANADQVVNFWYEEAVARRPETSLRWIP